MPGVNRAHLGEVLVDGLFDEQGYEFAELVVVDVGVGASNDRGQRLVVDVRVGDGQLRDEGVDGGVLGCLGGHRVEVASAWGVGVFEGERVVGGDDVVGGGVGVFAGQDVDRGPAGRAQ